MNSHPAIAPLASIMPVLPEMSPRPENRFAPIPGRPVGKAIQRMLKAILTMMLAVIFVPRAAAQNFTPTDIVVPEGGGFNAAALNDEGKIVGGYYTATAVVPAVWHNGVFTQLPLYPGTMGGFARGLNNNGQIVGSCTTAANVSLACVWESGTVRLLATVAGAYQSAAWAINDEGNIVGHVYTTANVDASRQAVIWQGASVAKLYPPVTGAQTWARAIDSTGRVAVSWIYGSPQWNNWWNAARWTPTVPNGLTGTMTTLSSGASAFDINDSGVVVALHYYSGGSAMLWDGTSGTELYSPYRGNVSAAAINNAGVAAGTSFDGDSWISTALVWDEGVNGRDLNYLLTSSSTYASPGTLAEAVAINGPGQVLISTSSGIYTLLTPSSDPVGPHQPAPPASVDAYPNDGAVDLYWPMAYYAESYSVKRSTVSGGPYTTIATGVPVNAYRDESVVNGTQYYYVVSSVNGAYESADSYESAATPVGVLPEPPTAVAAQGGNGFVNVQWSGAFYAESYNVKRSTVSGGPYTTVATGVLSSAYADTSVVNGTRYYYVVSSVNDSGESAHSDQVTAMPLAPPVAPTSLTATATKSGRSVKLAWKQSTSLLIQGNRVYRSTNGGVWVQAAQVATGINYEDSSVSRGVTYAYRVTALNVNGQESPASNTVTVRVK